MTDKKEMAADLRIANAIAQSYNELDSHKQIEVRRAISLLFRQAGVDFSAGIGVLSISILEAVEQISRDHEIKWNEEGIEIWAKALTRVFYDAGRAVQNQIILPADLPGANDPKN